MGPHAPTRYGRHTGAVSSRVPLPFSIDALLTGAVESVRLDFKATWDSFTGPSAVHTLCAFANDLQGVGGGYVVIGAEEAAPGVAKIPPRGLARESLESIQRAIQGQCRGWIEPEYQPLVAPVEYEGQALLVLYAPPGDVRPYRARRDPKGEHIHWVRLGTQTVEARGEVLRQLLALTAKITFDDRRRDDVPLDRLSPTILRKYLRDVGSDLADREDPLDVPAILRQMRLTAGTNGTEAPRNAAILLFSERPERHLPSAFVLVAQFDEEGQLLEERRFDGPIQSQVTETLTYLEGLSGRMIDKRPDNPQAQHYVAWPQIALREALVNAVLHRGYEPDTQATRVKLFPDRVEIISYPGPVPAVMPEHFAPGAMPPPAPQRNPRLGELLRALRLAELWQTGIPRIHREMQRNGSATPRFDFDSARTYFRATLPAHPEYAALHAARRATELWVTGDRSTAIELLQEAHRNNPSASGLALQTIDYAAEASRVDVARDAYQRYRATTATPHARVVSRYARALFDLGEETEAKRALNDLQLGADVGEVVQHAVLLKRANEMERAHQFFRSVEGAIANDARALHEYVGVKRALAGRLKGAQHATTRDALNREAEVLLRRVISLSGTEPARRGWAWLHLAEVLHWQRAPPNAIEEALGEARRLRQSDPALSRALDTFQGRR